MSNNICVNGFGTTMRFIFSSVEYADKLMIFQVFEKYMKQKLVHFRDVQKAREMNNAVKLHLLLT